MGVSRASPQWKSDVGRKGATLGMSLECRDVLERLGDGNPKDALETFFFFFLKPKPGTIYLGGNYQQYKEENDDNMSPCDTQ